MTDRSQITLSGAVNPLAIPAKAEADYTAWLIEVSEPEGPEYFQLVDDDNWSSNHDTALHFARKQDAEKYIADVGWTRARAVEHCWPAVAKAEAEVGVRETLECARQAIEYSLDMGGTDPGGVLLQTLNKLDAALANLPAKTDRAAVVEDGK